MRGDTLEYNADSYKVTESAVVEDLLKKMPGVEIDAEGKITVNGKEITKILVDGEEFFSDDEGGVEEPAGKDGRPSCRCRA